MKEKSVSNLLKPINDLNSSMEHRDVLYVAEQKTRWTAKELNVTINNIVLY
jgi:hypothetical protein